MVFLRTKRAASKAGVLLAGLFPAVSLLQKSLRLCWTRGSAALMSRAR